MSLWWTRKEQLDQVQLQIIENLPLRESFLVLGPPGSGKSNVLLRRAQFIRSQEMANVMVLTFTRSLVEFMKTGCVYQGREIFPQSCVSTIESWCRRLHYRRKTPLPDERPNLVDWKRALAENAAALQDKDRFPKYDALFVDEAQDLLSEEVALLQKWSDVLFFVGDDRQKLYPDAEGLEAVNTIPALKEHKLPFHYRIAPEICRVADRILRPQGGGTLEESCQYNGPRPGSVNVHGPLTKRQQLEAAADTLKSQIRVYGDLIGEGDRLGVIVARREDRDLVFSFLERDNELKGKAQIIRAPEPDDEDYSPSFDQDVPISILTVKGCKGLEFRAVHWLFCEELQHHHDTETYYTVVTRAKTSIGLYHSTNLPQELAGAYAPDEDDLW